MSSFALCYVEVAVCSHSSTSEGKASAAMLCPAINTTTDTIIAAPQKKVFLPGIWILYGVSITLQEFELLSTVGRRNSSVGEKRKRNKVGEEKVECIESHNDDKNRPLKRSKLDNEGDKVKEQENSTNIVCEETINYETLTPLQTIAEQDKGFIFPVPHTPYFVQRYKNGKAEEDVYFLQLFSDLLFDHYDRVPMERTRDILALSMDHTLQHFDAFVHHHLGDEQRKPALFSMLEVYEQFDSL